MLLQVEPPFRLISMLTRELRPRLWVQVICWVEPTRQLTAEFSGVLVRMGVPSVVRKFASEVSEPSSPPCASRATTLTRPCVVTGPGDAHVHERAVPARPVQPGIGVKLEPPLLEKARSNEPTGTADRAVHS